MFASIPKACTIGASLEVSYRLGEPEAVNVSACLAFVPSSRSPTRQLFFLRRVANLLSLANNVLATFGDDCCGPKARSKRCRSFWGRVLTASSRSLLQRIATCFLVSKS